VGATLSDFVAADTRPAAAGGHEREKRSTYDRLIRAPLGALGGFARYIDESPASTSRAGVRLRRAMALLFGVYAVVLEATSLAHGSVSAPPILIFLLGLAFFIGRGGAFIHYFVPLFLGLFAYIMAGRLAAQLKLTVHYLPQIDFDRWLIPGPLPTVWLQEHLYHGRTGPLELFAAGMYVSHFLVPLLLGFGLAMAGRGRAFASVMFGLLAVSVLGEITFVLLPTAPPWLASEHGLVPHVHHILRQVFFDVHLPKVAELIGDPSRYDVTAAVPSLHVAFPVVCLLAVRRHRLPRWVEALLVVNIVGVVFAIVYLGEHYVADAAAGVAYAFAAWWLVARFLEQDDEVVDRAATAPGSA
jgi:PAP2 superfamily